MSSLDSTAYGHAEVFVDSKRAQVSGIVVVGSWGSKLGSSLYKRKNVLNARNCLFSQFHLTLSRSMHFLGKHKSGSSLKNDVLLRNK